jgi:hypothetical protein
MTLAAEREMEHIGETRGMADHDHDLVHELSKRLDGLWRYDQHLANAHGKKHIEAFWQDLKQQERQNIDRLRELIKNEISEGCF